jgi:hypothetical protein
MKNKLVTAVLCFGSHICNQAARIRVKPLTLLSQPNREKYTFCILKSLEHLKNLKTGHVPCLGLELTMHDIKNHIHFVRQSL